MTERRPRRRLEGAEELRVMAHPLRVRVYYVLQALDAATATRLAETVNESPALVSYHLRKLQEHGFVEEAPELVNDHRERWWRPSSEGFRFSLPDDDDADVPEARAAAMALQRTALANQVERLQNWRDEQMSWGSAWMEAAYSSDLMLRMTPQELEAMNVELDEVIHAWRERTRTRTWDASDLPTDNGSAGDENDGREHVFVFLHSFPCRP